MIRKKHCRLFYNSKKIDIVNISPQKLKTLEEACFEREQLRNDNKIVVLTNGCFDLLHAGHVMALQQAKSLGDSLWVAINSDDSVRALKGANRPVYTEIERAFLLSALTVVDGIFIFNNKRLTNEILSFKPDIYVKSGDYTIKDLNLDERTALEKINAKIVFTPFLSGHSTTSTIKNILSK